MQMVFSKVHPACHSIVGPKLTPLALLDTPAWPFKGGFCANAININILYDARHEHFNRLYDTNGFFFWFDTINLG